MKENVNLEKIYSDFNEIIENNLDDLYMELEGEILELNQEDKEYFKRIKMNINSRVEEFENYIKENCNNTSRQSLENIKDEIQSFKEYMYDYMVYFVRKGFKIGVKCGAEWVIKYKK